MGIVLHGERKGLSFNYYWGVFRKMCSYRDSHSIH